MQKEARIFARFLILLFLGACGFSPIYGAKDKGETSVQESLNNISLSEISGEQGQFLRNRLIDRLYIKGRPVDPQAKLTIHLSSSESSLGIRKDATTTRSQLHMAAAYELTSLDGRKIYTKGTANSTASYSKLDAQYGTLATQRDSYNRALLEISEQIVNRLSLYYAEKAPTIKSSSGYLSDTINP